MIMKHLRYLFNAFKQKTIIPITEVLKHCECEDDLTLQRLQGAKYGGSFTCLTCGKQTEAKIVN